MHSPPFSLFVIRAGIPSNQFVVAGRPSRLQVTSTVNTRKTTLAHSAVIKARDKAYEVCVCVLVVCFCVLLMFFFFFVFFGGLLFVFQICTFSKSTSFREAFAYVNQGSAIAYFQPLRKLPNFHCESYSPCQCMKAWGGTACCRSFK